MSNPNDKIRMPRELREELSALVDEEWVHELAEDEFADEAGYNTVLSAIIPEGADTLEWDMVDAHGINEDLHDRVMRLAGPNVSAHDVVRHYVNEAKQRNARGEWVENGGTDKRATDDNTENHE